MLVVEEVLLWQEEQEVLLDLVEVVQVAIVLTLHQ
jgi:hypothetical protein